MQRITKIHEKIVSQKIGAIQYKTGKVFPFTISVHLMYVYTYWFSVYLSTLTLSFTLFLRNLQVEKHHKNVK